MRKKILKILGLAAIFAIALTGCATVGSISNQTPDELIFNGGSVVQVGNYLYYANGYTAVGDSSINFAYTANSKVSYLNRLDLSHPFGYKKDSPEKTEKVNSKVVGYENSYMFALGDYIYFTSPSTHKNSSLENTYNLVSLFRSRLNGDGLKEIMTTDQYDGATAQMRVLKGSDGNYYWIVYDGSNITSVKIGNTVGKKQVIARDVVSVAMPGENDSYAVTNIYYTKNRGEDSSELDVWAVDYATGKDEKATSNPDDIKFVGRVGDTVFYTSGSYETYYKEMSTSDSLVFSDSKQFYFYSTADIKNVHRICEGDADVEGYVFVGERSGSLVYKNTSKSESPDTLLEKGEYSQILYVQGDYVYYSTENAICRVSARDKTKQTVVTMQNSITGKVSVADEYIYFYAQLEPVDEDDTKEYENDTNYYMYRVQMGQNQDYQILAKFTRTEVKS